MHQRGQMIKKYINPWYGYICIMAGIAFWHALDAISGKLTQNNGLIICGLLLVNIFVAHAWKIAHDYERTARYQELESFIEATKDYEPKFPL